MAGDLGSSLSAPTVFSNVSIGGVNSNNAGFGQLSVSSVIQLVGGVTLSKGSADFRTNSVIQSWVTKATESGMTIGQIAVLFQASGVSLVYSSGKTVYIIGGSATSGAQT